MSEHTPCVFVDWRTLEIVIRGPYEYRVDLETLTTAARVLDMMFQVAGKTWCNAAIAKGLLDCLEGACEKRFDNNLQGVFCPSGRSGMVVDWKRKTYVAFDKGGA